MKDTLYTTGDVARTAGVSLQAIYNAIKRGALTPKFMSPTGRVFFDASEVQQYAQMQLVRKMANCK
jgi:hypothetical protein